MGILTETSMKHYKDRLFAIHPHIPEAMTGVGYDFHIGYYATVVQGQPTAPKQVMHPDVSQNDALVLAPNASVLIVSYEHTCLSNRLAGTLHMRSKYAAKGLFLNSTTVDPNWAGRLVFIMHNASTLHVKIGLAEHFCTIVFHETRHRSERKPSGTTEIVYSYAPWLKNNSAENGNGATDDANHDGIDEHDIVLYANGQLDKTKDEFEKHVKKVRAATNSNELLVRLHFAKWFVGRHILYFGIAIVVLIPAFLWTLTLVTDWEFSDFRDLRSIVTLLVAIAAIVSAIAALYNAYSWLKKRFRKDDDSETD